MSQSLPSSDRPGLTRVQWLICIMAAIGFAFDIYELLMLPLVARPALLELTGAAPGTPEFQMWVGRLFYIPAFMGGIFGLLGGYLTDYLGRRRVLTWSILLYAVSAFLSGFSTSIWMLLVLRCTTFVGVCVEFVAAVAWLAELFPDHQRKERVLGYTQAFSSAGGLLVAVVNGLLIKYGSYLPAIDLPDFMLLGEGMKDVHAPWRYTLMSGLIPAIPLIVIRPFLPESPAWAQKRAAGTLRRPSFAELFSPGLARTTIVTTIMFACSYGAAFGALQQMPQMVPGLADVQADVADKPVPEQRKHYQLIASEYTKLQEVGGLLGRLCLALLAVRILSRRSLLRVFQGPGLIIVPLVYFAFLRVENTHFFTIDLTSVLLGKLPVTTVSLGLMLAGFFTVAQFSFWGNYLPRVYPMHLRGTGESFAANIGGRMIGTSFAWVTATLAPMWTGRSAPEQFALTAGCVALFVYGVGFICSFFLPEPEHDDVHE